MTEKLNLYAIEARCEVASEWLSCVGTYRVYMKSIADAHADISVLVAEVRRLYRDLHALQKIEALHRSVEQAEVRRLRDSLEAVLEEASSDLDRDIIITECQSALAETGKEA